MKKWKSAKVTVRTSPLPAYGPTCHERSVPAAPGERTYRQRIPHVTAAPTLPQSFDLQGKPFVR
jgi:hypothetical protein